MAACESEIRLPKLAYKGSIPFARSKLLYTGAATRSAHRLVGGNVPAAIEPGRDGPLSRVLLRLIHCA